MNKYQVEEYEWAPGRKDYHVLKNGVQLYTFSTFDEAIARLEQMKFQQNRKIVHEEEF